MPRRILIWISRKIGNRGAVAVILGLIWFLVGLSMILDPPEVNLPGKSFEPWVKALPWLVCGGLALAWYVVPHAGKEKDHNVWALLVLPPAVRLAQIVAAGLLELAHKIWTFEGYHYEASWVGAAVWLVTVALIDRCAAGLDRLPPGVIVKGPVGGIQ